MTSPHLETLKKGHYPDLARFLIQHDHGSRTEAFWLNRFSHWWDENPVYQKGDERGWCLKDNNRIVGFLGIVPSKYQIMGKETVVFNSTTWRVDQHFRNHSLDLLFKQLEVGKEFVLLKATPNAVVSKILDKLNLKPIPKGNDLEKHCSLHIIHPEKVIRMKFSILARLGMISKLVGQILTLIIKLRTRNLMKVDSSNVRELTVADSTFDELWKRTSKQYANTYVRDSETVQWQCFANKEIPKKCFGYYHNRQLLGYIVGWSVQGQKDQLRMIECLDLWTDHTYENVVPALMKRLHDYAVEENYDAILFPHFNNQLRDLLVGLGFQTVHFGKRNEYMKAPSEIEASVDASNSYFVGLVGDKGL